MTRPIDVVLKKMLEDYTQKSHIEMWTDAAGQFEVFVQEDPDYKPKAKKKKKKRRPKVVKPKVVIHPTRIESIDN